MVSGVWLIIWFTFIFIADNTFISNNQSKSDQKLIHCGVFQGSLIGLLFFLIYINNLNFAFKSQPRFFADDNCVIVIYLNPEQLLIKINSTLQNLHQWCCVNKLLINPVKTNIIIIPPKQTTVAIPHLHLTSNGFPENIVDSAKDLGFVIDTERATFSSNILDLNINWDLNWDLI